MHDELIHIYMNIEMAYLVARNAYLVARNEMFSNECQNIEWLHKT